MLLVPSAFVAWSNRDMPQFGATHDDGVYFVCAKAWATGQGHRIISLPGEPWQTKYPPLYPLLLSMVWRVSPEFPQNLPLTVLLSWCFLPPALLLLYFLYRRYGFASWQIWLMLAWFAINPYSHVFTISVLSEVPFTFLLLAVLLLAPDRPLVAGVVAGFAYLTRTAGLPLLLAVPGIFLFQRQWRPAIRFAGAMLPFAVGWMWWSGVHKLYSDDPYWMYYLDYSWYERYIVHASNLHLVVWKNFDALLRGMGSFILPADDNILTRMLSQTIAVGMIVGIYKMTRERYSASMYALFGLLFCLLMLIWHYPPNPRFLFPLFPLLLAGFGHQLSLAVRLIQRAYRAGQQRAAAVIVTVLLAALGAFVFAANFRFMTGAASAYYRDYREKREETFQCAKRISDALPAGAAVMTNQDTAVYLLSGRKSMRMTIPPSFWYEDRLSEVESEWRKLPQVATAHGVTHLFYSRKLPGDLSQVEQRRLVAFLDTTPETEPLFQCGEGRVYRVR